MAVVKKIFSTLASVLAVLMMVIALFVVGITVFGERSSDGTVTAFGYQGRIVISDSMGKSDLTDVSMYDIKEIPVRSFILVKVVPAEKKDAAGFYADIKKGDVLTFNYRYDNSLQTITHRVVEDPVRETDGSYIFTMEGDNKTESNNLLKQVVNTGDGSSNRIIGKVVFSSYLFGKAILALRTPFGIMAVIAVAVAELAFIFFAPSKDKKKNGKETVKENSVSDEDLERKKAEYNELLAMKAELERLRDARMAAATPNPTSEMKAPVSEVEVQSADSEEPKS